VLGRLWKVAVSMGAATLVVVGLSGGVRAQTAAPSTYSIGVDAMAPVGHNWEYTNFFPSAGISVHNGDVLDFKWGLGISLDALHTATVLPLGETAAQAWQAEPLLVAAPGATGGSRVTNPALNPTFPLPGSGPGGCGTSAKPCAFTGASVLNSGPNNGGNDFYVKVGLPSGTTGSFQVVDLIHPGMSATVTVVTDGAPTSTQSELDTAAASQLTQDTSEALAAEGAAQPTVTTNPDGTHLVTAYAGVTTPDVQIDEMLPAHLTVHPGDSVKWVVASYIHTVTFPYGSDLPQLNPFPGTNGFNPAAFGPTAIENGGYRTTAADGEEFNFGHAIPYGSAATYHPSSPIVAIADSADGKGYWQVGANGSVYSFGDAPFVGSAAGKVSAPISAIIVDPRGFGYVLVGQDGSAYVFDTQFPGPPPARITPAKLAAPIVAAAGNGGQGNGPGFWAAAADGGVFTYGAATFFGSAASLHLASPIVGMDSTPDGGGYWLVASDGGVFNYGDARFFGSLGGTHLNAPIVGIVRSADGGGYSLLAADGGVFTFGDATYDGSTGGMTLAAPMTAIDAVPGTTATSGVLSQPSFVTGLATSYTFTFPEKGKFSYQCEIHDHMVGMVTVS
jgi:plastocyanin